MKIKVYRSKTTGRFVSEQEKELNPNLVTEDYVEIEYWGEKFDRMFDECGIRIHDEIIRI